jgi:hypothetical protein
LNWQIDKAEYKYDKMMSKDMPSRKEWYFTIWFDTDKGKNIKMQGYLTAAGAGSVEDPLERYDMVVVIW